ncbi:MAG: c-type cytochrome, partial [Myxococcota bacterium]
MISLIFITSLALAASPTRRLPDDERGAELYMKNCWMCHGKVAEGNGPAAEALSTESPALAKRYEKTEWDKVIRVIMDGKGDMPAFSPVMDRHEARRILIWLDDPKPIKASTKKSGKIEMKNKKQVPPAKTEESPTKD